MYKEFDAEMELTMVFSVNQLPQVSLVEHLVKIARIGIYLKIGEKIIIIIISLYFNHELKRLRMSSPSRARILCSENPLVEISLSLLSVPHLDF